MKYHPYQNYFTFMLGLIGMIRILSSSQLAFCQTASQDKIDFNTQIRPILSNRCFACHGPDEQTVESGLRLDSFEAATAVADSGKKAIEPGAPDSSEIIRRILADDEQVRMPPPRFGQRLTPAEADLIKRWVQSGARYTKHWSYERIQAPPTPELIAAKTTAGMSVQDLETWASNPIDRHLLSRMQLNGLAPSVQADRTTLLRRLTLDLTGLPPSIDEHQAFLSDTDPLAYERLVDRLLASPAYGEHWGRRWLDLARYADSAGYADDPARTIWAYRDWVVRAFNSNMPFDQFTIEQLAGDLLDNPTPDQLVATAFHRNTLTNNEGGTNDEEFRNVAIVDRVNTTMAAWMGATMGCAQCHNHKYDPISQKEYFEVFSIFNQTEDADRGDESPTYAWYSPEQRDQRNELERRSQELETQLEAPDPSLASAQIDWEKRLLANTLWQSPIPRSTECKSGNTTEILQDGLVKIDSKADTDTIRVQLPLPQGWTPEKLRGIRIETVPDGSLPGGGVSHGDGNIVLTSISANLVQEPRSRAQGRFVRVELPGKDKILSLAEVQVFDDQKNVALQGKATQSSEILGGAASRAIDGNTSGKWEDNSITHTNTSESPWWELDLGGVYPVDRISVFNRVDNGVSDRLSGANILLLDENRKEIWRGSVSKAQAENKLDLEQQVAWNTHYAAADHEQAGFPAIHAIDNDPKTGWAIGGAINVPHALQIAGQALRPTAEKSSSAPWILRLQLGFDSQHKRLILSRFRVSLTDDQQLAETLKTPKSILDIIRATERTDPQNDSLHRYYVREVAPERSGLRDNLSKSRQALANLKPITTVPILKELAKDRRRTTKIQLRGNYKVTGDEVSPGIPSIFGYQAEPEQQTPINRLTFARWLVSERNPLTARVLANRTWEYLFGVGIVRTSEEFGSQGDLPVYPELLDHLASEFMASGWDVKELIRSIVLSNAYKQSSSVTQEAFEADPENIRVTRGPRFRVAAEQVRDMALASAGLLTNKFYGPPTRPPQPNMGLSAAFGSRTDWETSTGEDRYRRAIYTQWRRSNPYPSMTTFDAPTREVCVLKRDRTNTPLQALVTLNDPVYIEAAQGLARRVLVFEADQALDDRSKVERMFQLVLTRKPSEKESQSMLSLIQDFRDALRDRSEQAMKLASEPIGKIPEGVSPQELASWVSLGNVLLNLDEFLMTP
ncbi:MAG: DUF1553 domain-containing protein [Pirellula sp.]